MGFSHHAATNRNLSRRDVIKTSAGGVAAAAMGGLGIGQVDVTAATSGKASASSASLAIPALQTPVAATTPMPPGWQELGVMQGFPPAPDKVVTKANWIQPPYIRWAAQHAREVGLSRRVWRGDRGAHSLSYALVGLDSLEFPDEAGKSVTLVDAFAQTYTDAFLVLHRGEVVYEAYFNGMEPSQPHTLASMTKSVTGVLATTLAAEGKLDLGATGATYIPELTGTPFGEATLQQMLDMLVPVSFLGVDQDVALFRAAGLLEPPADYTGPRTIYDYLPTPVPEGEAGSAFQYQNGCPETIAWAMRRVTGQSLTELFSSRIWTRLGVEEDADFLIDPQGTEVAASGIVTTLRDLGRFGEMLRNDGMVQGTQVVPREVTAQIRAGFATAAPELREIFSNGHYEDTRPGSSYHNFWWIPNDQYGAFQGNGRFGQRLYIAPGAEMVIAQFGSTADFADIKDTLMHHAFVAIAEQLSTVR